MGIRLVVVAGLAAGVVACDVAVPRAAPEPSPLADATAARRPAGVPDDAEPARVDRIVDGDTLRVVVDEPGGSIAPTDSERVRLLSIDAPELAHPERGEDCGAREAAARFAQLAPPGSRIWLAADVEDRDRFGRALRHVWTADGTDVSATLVAEGLARARLYRPNARFHAPLARLDGRARDAEAGVWGALCEHPPWAAGRPVVEVASSVAASGTPIPAVTATGR